MNPSRAWAVVVLAVAACTPAGRTVTVRKEVDARFVRYSDAEAAQVKDVHSYKGQPLCQGCHAGDTAALIAGPVHTCERCHAKARHTPGHESGTKLDVKRVGGLPLPGGVVVCHTCHDAHDVKKHRHGLRMPVNAVCLSCHPRH